MVASDGGSAGVVHAVAPIMERAAFTKDGLIRHASWRKIAAGAEAMIAWC